MPDEPDDQAAAAAEAASAALRRATRSTTKSKKGQQPKPSRRSTALPDGRDPQTLSAAVEGLIRDQGWQDQSAVAVLISEWSQIVGRDIADHVTPVSFDEGELILQAESTAWATQVRLLLPQVHRAVDERVGRGVVTAIRIRGPQAPNWSAGPRRVPGRGPRDTYG
ncbi:MAG: DciA family protein [Actinobacteria bacterium]|nr:DciA family protein [Actinomycetota bacterium]